MAFSIFFSLHNFFTPQNKLYSPVILVSLRFSKFKVFFPLLGLEHNSKKGSGSETHCMSDNGTMSLARQSAESALPDSNPDSPTGIKRDGSAHCAL